MVTLTIGAGLFALACIIVFVKVERSTNRFVVAATMAWVLVTGGGSVGVPSGVPL